MAFLSVLLSFLTKKVGSLLQAIFGWSVSALFGRLPARKQAFVTVALVLSLAWPVFVVGLIVPAVAGWVLAFLPLQQWFGAVALRIVWGALAFVAPLLVGALVHAAAPSKKGSLARALVLGYPLALGFFVAFVVTAITVPIVKIATVLKGWTDEHVYVQPRRGEYQATLRELAEAAARAGAVPVIEQAPKRMMIATNALRFFARGAVSPIVAEQIRRVVAEDVEVYLYPSDLLVRGESDAVARFRAMMTRTHLDRHAYLVPSDRAQAIQDELARLVDVMTAHDARGQSFGAPLASRLVDVWREMSETNLAYDEWVTLESIARRVERRFVHRTAGVDVLPLDRAGDRIEEIAAKSNAAREDEIENDKETKMAIERPPSSRTPVQLEEASTADLVKEAMDEAKQLVKLEVALAKDEVKEELAKAKHAAIGFGIAAGAALLVLMLLAMALVLALGGTAVTALLVALAFLVIGGVAGFVGWSLLPKEPLVHTRHRLETDLNQLKEHVA